MKLTLNPPPISPITFSTGTGTLSKDTSHAGQEKKKHKLKMCESRDCTVIIRVENNMLSFIIPINTI